jgi:alkaline phosphatase
MLKRAVQAAAMAGAVALGAAAPGVAQGAVARNVIVIQGDGMGTAQRDLIRLVGVGPGGELAMNTFPHAGLVHTDPADPEEAVTDSAAAATAYSTGYKTFNGAVGVDAKGLARATLLEVARRAGKATGLVTTSQVTDASPAAFGAHVKDRDDQSEIARQFLVRSKPDVILGGGEDRWLPPGTEGAWPDAPAKDPTEKSSGTKGNLIERAQDLGYRYVSNRAQLRRAPNTGKLLGLFDNEEMFEHREEGQGDLYDPVVPLAEMGRKALRVLSRDKQGFFLFLEEEGIDEMAHENNAGLMVKSGLALDRAVAMAKRFQRSHPNTLILVEGDHETGGLTIENPDDEDESGDELSAEDGPFAVNGTKLEVFADWTTGQHTGADTPITAGGPGSARLGRVIDNTDVHDAVLRAMGLDR